jgi:hypothetical protein
MSLSSYVSEINAEINKLRRDVTEIQRENRELKEILTRSHHHWWRHREPTKTTDELVDDLIHETKQADYLRWR